MAKEIPQHYDKLGSELFVGDYVLAPYGNRQTIVSAKKQKMIAVSSTCARCNLGIWW